jgi:hypothetical protein
VGSARVCARVSVLSGGDVERLHGNIFESEGNVRVKGVCGRCCNCDKGGEVCLKCAQELCA